MHIYYYISQLSLINPSPCELCCHGWMRRTFNRERMIILIPVPSHPSWHSCQLTILHFMLCNTQFSAQAHNTRGHKSTTSAAAMELYGVGRYYYEEAPETKQLFEEYCCLSFIHNARGTARLAVTRPPRHMDTRKLTSSFFVLLKNEATKNHCIIHLGGV